MRFYQFFGIVIKILYNNICILCIFIYADNFKEILLLQIIILMRLILNHNNGVAVAYCKKEILIILQKNIIKFLKS